MRESLMELWKKIETELRNGQPDYMAVSVLCAQMLLGALLICNAVTLNKHESKNGKQKAKLKRKRK